MAQAAQAGYARRAFDVVVLGGGIVGSSLAALLASTPTTKHLRVALLEQRPPQQKLSQLLERHLASPPALRLSAIAPPSVSLLQRCNVWESVRECATPVDVMHVWEWYSSGYLRFDTDLNPTIKQLAFILENDILQTSLFERLQSLSNSEDNGFQLFSSSKVSSVDINQTPTKWPTVSLLDDDEPLSCRLLIGADGPNSMVRKAASINCSGHQYGDEGLVASIRVSNHQNAAWQRFLPTGPLGVLPCREDMASIVWSLPSSECDALKALSPDKFVERLNRALTVDSRIPSASSKFLPEFLSDLVPVLLRQSPPPPTVMELCSPVASFPLRHQNALSYIGARVALMGDSAHVMHPLAGQGLNTGLNDVRVMAEVLQKAVTTGQDLGEEIVLKQYQKQSKKHADLMMFGVDGLKSVFQQKFAPFAIARNIGMDVLNAIPALKNRITSTVQH